MPVYTASRQILNPATGTTGLRGLFVIKARTVGGQWVAEATPVTVTRRYPKPVPSPAELPRGPQSVQTGAAVAQAKVAESLLVGAVGSLVEATGPSAQAAGSLLVVGAKSLVEAAGRLETAGDQILLA